MESAGTTTSCFAFELIDITNQNAYIKCINIVIRKTLYDILFVLVTTMQIFYTNPQMCEKFDNTSNLCFSPCEQALRKMIPFFKHHYCKDNFEEWNSECDTLQTLAFAILEHVEKWKKNHWCFKHNEDLRNKFFLLKEKLEQHVKEIGFTKDNLDIYLNSINEDAFEITDEIVDYNMDENIRIYNYESLWWEYLQTYPVFFKIDFVDFIEQFDKLLVATLNGVCVGTVFMKAINHTKHKMEKICDSLTLKALHGHLHKNSCRVGDKIIGMLEAKYSTTNIKILVNPIFDNPKWKEKLKSNALFQIGMR